ncbi:MAG TPA: cobalamin-binding protein, partial [Desulfosporosinus sp.]|nr:cobalamin-binding protein [Desulfosporosinus sp.]
MTILAEIKKATMEGNARGVTNLTKQALEAKVNINDIVNDGFISAMGIIGEKFKNGEIYVPEMLIAARAMKAGLKVLEPLLLLTTRDYIGKAIIGTVQGDLHDMGKNLVSMMLQGAGWDVIDLGVNVTPEKFVEAVVTHQPQIVGLSALLTTTMPAMKLTIEALVKAGLRDKVKV